MNIFTLDVSNSSNIVNGIKSGLWVERFLTGGEFSFKGDDPDRLMSALPLDSLVSHTNTLEVMMVEEYRIDESKEDGTSIEVVGRSLDEIMMENRIVTINQPHLKEMWLRLPGSGFLVENLDAWDGAKLLIESYLKTSVETSNENFSNLVVRTEFEAPEPEKRSYLFENLETLNDAVTQILKDGKCGIRTERPVLPRTTMDFVIHQGIDRQGLAQFSWQLGDLNKARYVISTKDNKTGGYVYNQEAVYLIDSSKVGKDARMAKIDANDLNIEFSEPPTTGEKNTARALLRRRGQAELAQMKVKTLVDAEINPNSRLKYQKDYFIGDIVKVLGNYDTKAGMRVTEYAISWDEQGQVEYPTLAGLHEEED